MWKYCEICCVSITIYAGSYKYLKEKKKYKRKTDQKKKLLEQTKVAATDQNLGKKKGSLHQKRHYKGIVSFYIFSRKKAQIDD